MKWKEVFNVIKEKEYAKELHTFLDEEYAHYVIYPKRENIFNAFKACELDKVKVVIFGQDPYHEPGQAMGLAFSVPNNVPLPPSLQNIYREIDNEYNRPLSYHGGDLTYLAKQGVLLLNTVLTVREHQPQSHNNNLYRYLIMDIVKALDALDQPLVFMLWGGNAKKFAPYLTNENHLVLTANHPSPLSANKGGWFGNGHFKKANDYLLSHGLTQIKWIND